MEQGVRILFWSSLFVACQISKEDWCGVHDLFLLFSYHVYQDSAVMVVPRVYHLPGHACRNPGTDREGLCDCVILDQVRIIWANCILQRIDSSNILGWRVFIWLFIRDHRPRTLEHWSTSHTGLILCLWRCSCDLMFVQESLHRPLGCFNKLVPVGEWWFVCEESAAVHIAIQEQKHFAHLHFIVCVSTPQ